MLCRDNVQKFFEHRLVDFFRKSSRDMLPWRRKGISAYEVWVSEVMLQQTQVSRVIPYYVRFLKRFPTINALSSASWEEFLPYYSGLGYYARGRNMLRTAEAVIWEHGGEFPQAVNVLRSLPGVGPYTAAAIASFAYGHNILAWDTNLRRVIGRFFFGTKEISDWNKRDRKRSDISLDSENPFSVPARILNAALMDFGSSLCTGKPKCGACPLVTRCRFFNEGGRSEDKVPRNSKSDTIPFGNHGAIVVLHENHRRYFSQHKKRYQPFLIDESHATRSGIKEWFLDRYGLRVSVRPPHGKIHFGKRRDILILVNVQILSGAHSFSSFSANDAKMFEMSSRSMKNAGG